MEERERDGAKKAKSLCNFVQDSPHVWKDPGENRKVDMKLIGS